MGKCGIYSYGKIYVWLYLYDINSYIKFPIYIITNAWKLIEKHKYSLCRKYVYNLSRNLWIISNRVFKNYENKLYCLWFFLVAQFIRKFSQFSHDCKLSYVLQYNMLCNLSHSVVSWREPAARWVNYCITIRYDKKQELYYV